MGKVIIDGVDVSGCEFFSDMSNGKPDTRCECYKDMYGFNTNCKHNKDAKNCYYKQLKRKEQECEELKKLNNILNIAFTSISNSNIDKIIKQLQNRSEE